MSVDENMAILIVDDYKTMLRILKNLLRQMGFNNVDEATDGTTAMKMLRTQKYDMVIADWDMTPMNGLQLLREVRANSTSKNTPFIMMNSENGHDYVIQAKEAGVSNYIVKPFNKETLKSKMESVIGEF